MNKKVKKGKITMGKLADMMESGFELVLSKLESTASKEQVDKIDTRLQVVEETVVKIDNRLKGVEKKLENIEV